MSHPVNPNPSSLTEAEIKNYLRKVCEGNELTEFPTHLNLGFIAELLSRFRTSPNFLARESLRLVAVLKKEGFPFQVSREILGDENNFEGVDLINWSMLLALRQVKKY
jgi:hypothetical protein